VFSRARWCFRQCAWPPDRRHARENHWRAREKAAMEGWGVAMRIKEKRISDLKFEISDLGAAGGEGKNLKFI
jgi:hypothetical protein